MNRLARHEAFQRWVAEKCRAAGAIVISTSTTAPCDLVVQPKFHSPIFVEIKTKGRGQGRTGALKPLQRALRDTIKAFPEYGAWFVTITRAYDGGINIIPYDSWLSTVLDASIAELKEVTGAP